MKKLLIVIVFISLSGCGSTPFHTIAGSDNRGWENENGDIKVISDYKIGAQQIRVVRHKNDSCISGYKDYIELNGAINKDSSLILERVLNDIVSCKSVSGTNYVTPVYMNSLGGAVKDGIKIGRIFKKYGVQASIISGQVCASSCAFAYLGAKYRDMQAGGELLFHSPYNNLISGIDCGNKEDERWLEDYYIEMIGETNGSILYDRTMDYCSAKSGWAINADTAKIFGITNN